MNLRGRYYLAILPLFAGLAVLNGALVYVLERNEIRWTLEQRATATAVGIAGFWPLLLDRDGEEKRAHFEALSERLGGLHIRWYRLRDGAYYAETLYASEALAPPPVPDAEVVAALDEAPAVWRLEPDAADEYDLNISYASVRQADGTDLGIVAVVEADRSGRAAMGALWERLGKLFAGLLLAGILAAELITRIARRELWSLNRTATEIVEGRALSPAPPARIKEIGDLSGTLQTMTSLLADGNQQTRRRFFQAEVLPGDRELAIGYLRRREREMPCKLGSVPLVCRHVGAPLPEDVIGWRESDNGIYLIAGRMQLPEEPLSELRRLVRADTALNFLLGVAVARPNGPSWPEALRGFPFDVLHVVFIPATGRRPTGWTLDPRRGLPQSWDPTRPREMLETMPAPMLTLGQTYLDQVPERGLTLVADELAALLSTRHQGLLVVCEFPLSNDT